MNTSKERVMNILINHDASAEDIAWANSHLPCINEKGQYVAEGLDLKCIPWNHSSNSTIESCGLTRKEGQALSRKLEDVVEELHEGKKCDGTDCPSLSQITQRMFQKGLTPKEASFLILQGINSINEANHSRSMREEGEMPELLKRLLSGHGGIGILGIGVKKAPKRRGGKKS